MQNINCISISLRACSKASVRTARTRWKRLCRVRSQAFERVTSNLASFLAFHRTHNFVSFLVYILTISITFRFWCSFMSVYNLTFITIHVRTRMNTVVQVQNQFLIRNDSLIHAQSQAFWRFIGQRWSNSPICTV